MLEAEKETPSMQWTGCRESVCSVGEPWIAQTRELGRGRVPTAIEIAKFRPGLQFWSLCLGLLSSYEGTKGRQLPFLPSVYRCSCNIFPDTDRYLSLDGWPQRRLGGKREGGVLYRRAFMGRDA